MLTPIDHPLPTRPDLYRRRRFINHLLTYLLTYNCMASCLYNDGVVQTVAFAYLI